MGTDQFLWVALRALGLRHPLLLLGVHLSFLGRQGGWRDGHVEVEMCPDIFEALEVLVVVVAEEEGREHAVVFTPVKGEGVGGQRGGGRILVVKLEYPGKKPRLEWRKKKTPRRRRTGGLQRETTTSGKRHSKHRKKVTLLTRSHDFRLVVPIRLVARNQLVLSQVLDLWGEATVSGPRQLSALLHRKGVESLLILL